MKNSIVRFIDCHVPTETCNLRCPYCYIGQRRSLAGTAEKIGHSPEEVRRALSKERFGGVMLLNFCAGGETLLGDDILPIIYRTIEEGHFAQIVTNGTISKRFSQIAKWPKHVLDKLFIKFSFHYTELKRLDKIDEFFNNILIVKGAGCSISLEITPGDEMIPYIDEMKQISMERLGALPHVSVARNENTSGFEILTAYDRQDYIDIWKTFDSPMFTTKMKLLSDKREEYCYGGEWTFFLNLGSGDLKQCYRGDVIDNIYEDVSQPIHFRPIGNKCPEKYCYNGHAWLTLGAIPDIDVPSYAEIRNRKCSDGTGWLTDIMNEFFSHKLKEQHVIYKKTDRKPKILLMGDSICEGYREVVERNLCCVADVFYPKENARFSTYLLRYLHEWAKNLGIGTNVDIVYFNVGLWDILRLNGDEPLVDVSTYAQNLRRIIHKMKYLFPNAEIIFATTTPVKEEEAEYSFLRLNQDILEYNRCAKRIMDENHVIMHDLYQIAVRELKDNYSDGTHFNENGYQILGRRVSDFIKDVLGEELDCNNEISQTINNSKILSKPELLFKKRIIIYGAGKYGKWAVEEIEKQEIAPFIICDSAKEKQGILYHGVNIISPEKYKEDICDIDEDILIIAIKDYSIVKEVAKNFRKIQGLTICTMEVLKYLDLANPKRTDA